MRIMAIDYGDAHTGVAVSDLTGLLAGHTETVHTWRKEELLRRLGDIIGEYGVTELVLGYPLAPGRRRRRPSPRTWRRPSPCRSASGTSGAPPWTPTTFSRPRERTRKSGKRPWTP